jgi:hypothetical protein
MYVLCGESVDLRPHGTRRTDALERFAAPGAPRVPPLFRKLARPEVGK